MTDYPAFEQFFSEVHGHRPYHWQQELARFVAAEGRLPDRVAVPTGLGKTATVDVVVWALGKQLHEGAPRTLGQRIFHVVERRVVVDGAYGHVLRIQQALTDAVGPASKVVADALRLLSSLPGRDPLRVQSIHGGIGDTGEWLEATGASVVVATATQFCLRLLARGPGVSDRVRPMHAGLTGIDRTVLFDEPHLADVMVELIRGTAELQRSAPCDLGVPVGDLCLLGATIPPRLFRDDDTVVEFDPALETGHAELLHRAPRPVHIRSAEVDTAKQAEKAVAAALYEEVVSRYSEARRTAVIVNTVAMAEAVVSALSAKKSPVAQTSIRMITSRVRAVDRAARSGGAPVIEVAPGEVLVATQAVEVGADFSVDDLITELAPWPSLVQRLGRLNRDGRSSSPSGVVVVTRDDFGEPLPREGTTAVYGETPVLTTARALLTVPGSTLDGSLQARRSLEASLFPEGTVELWPVPQRAAMVEQDYFERLMMTSPVAAEDCTTSVWLTGPDDVDKQVADVEVCWRSDLGSDHSPLLDRVRPGPSESVTVTATIARAIVAADKLPATMSDVDETEEAPTRSPKGIPQRLGLVRVRDHEGWRAPSSLRDIRPGSSVVLHTSLGGYLPGRGITDSRSEVADMSGVVAWESSRPRWFALTPAVWSQLPPEFDEESMELIDSILTDDEIKLRQRPGRIADVVMSAAARNGAPRRCEVAMVDGVPLARWVDRRRRSNPNTEVTLADHSALTAALAAAAASSAGVDPGVAAAMVTAAHLHDHGKAHPAFQRMLGAMPSGPLLAKSVPSREMSPQLAGLPPHFDHAAAGARSAAAAGHDELVVHLIAAHHGSARPFVRHAIESVDGVGPYLRLSRDLGCWGLAWAEAQVRLADWLASADPRPCDERGMDPSILDHLAALTDGGRRPDRPVRSVDETGHRRRLPGLGGRSSLSWFAAVGVLAAVAEVDPTATIEWDEQLVPTVTSRIPLSDEAVVDSINALPESLDEVNEAVIQVWKLSNAGLFTDHHVVAGIDNGISEINGGVRSLRTHEWSTRWSGDTTSTLFRSHVSRKLTDKGAKFQLLATSLHRNGNNFKRSKNTDLSFTIEMMEDSTEGWFLSNTKSGSDSKKLSGSDASLDRDDPNTGPVSDGLRGGLLRAALLGGISLGTSLGEWGVGYLPSPRSRTLELPLPELPVTLAELSAVTMAGRKLLCGTALASKLRTENQMIFAVRPRVEHWSGEGKPAEQTE